MEIDEKSSALDFENARILNENLAAHNKEVAELKEMLKQASLTPEQKAAEQAKAEAEKPLTKAELLKIEEERNQKFLSESEKQKQWDEYQNYVLQQDDQIETNVSEWLASKGVDINEKNHKVIERAYETYLFDAVDENKTKYKDTDPKFWESVENSIREKFAAFYGMEITDEDKPKATVSKSSKWLRHRSGDNSSGKSMTMTGDSVGVSLRPKGELDEIKQKLQLHREGKVTMDAVELIRLSDKLDQLTKS